MQVVVLIEATKVVLTIVKRFFILYVLLYIVASMAAVRAGIFAIFRHIAVRPVLLSLFL